MSELNQSYVFKEIDFISIWFLISLILLTENMDLFERKYRVIVYHFLGYHWNVNKNLKIVKYI